MNVVTPFEARLLTLLQFLLRRGVAELALAREFRPLSVPSRLSRTAIHLIQDTLAKGTTLLLARSGGWQRQRHLRGDQAVEGRLWERTSPKDLAFTFSGATLEFLLSLTSSVTGEIPLTWSPDLADLTLGDQVFFYCAYSAMRHDPANRQRGLSSHPAFSRHGLCRLAYPGDFPSPKSGAEPDYALWTEGPGSCILEVLQSELHHSWLQLERSKEEIDAFARMRSLGRAQQSVLDGFLQAVESTQRRDLARFLLATASVLLTPTAGAQNWVGGLKTVAGQRLAERMETHRLALVFVRVVERLKTWERQTRATGYLDEGYVAAQLWLSDWERFEGDTLYARAQAILRHLDPMKGSEGTS